MKKNIILAAIVTLMVIGGVMSTKAKPGDGLTDQQKLTIRVDCAEHPKALRCL